MVGRSQRKKAFAFIVVFFMGVFAGAMDWPAPEARLLTNFGANAWGKPSLGYSFRGGGAVRAAEAGELLFTRKDGVDGSRLPAPLGVRTALDHGDGLISIYSRLDEKNTPTLMKTIDKDAVIGQTGISGMSLEKGFHFSLFDRKERRWINPGLVISRLADSRPPVIQAVTLVTASGRTVNLPAKNIGQGQYSIFVTVFDFAPSSDASLAPYRIICSLNGREVGAVVLETFSARDGILWAQRNSPTPAKQVYASAPAFELGTASFTRGQASLEIIAQDINENTQNAVYRFAVD